jgi:major vault protein
MTNLEQITKENVITRPIKRLVYGLRPDEVTLDKEQYAHFVNKRTGDIRLVEGPKRVVLDYDERLKENVKQKVLVPENHYCIVENPVDAQKNIQYGDREIREGPLNFSLHPGEKLSVSPTKEHVLTKYEGLLIKATDDFDAHKAGDKFVVKGPTTYIPSKHEHIVSNVNAIPLSDTDGKYVQNEDTGDVTLVKGPQDYFLQPNEKLWSKELTEAELQGLGLRVQLGGNGVRILTRQAANTSFLNDPSDALVLELEDNEVVFIQDGSDSRIEKGPETIFLDPYERPKVLNLSGGKPIQQGALNVALLKLGPDFIYHRVNVRTKDNAKLEVDVTYKWRFDLKDDELKKAFGIDDFVGYAAETLSSEIRSVAAQYDFEEFHADSLEHITTKIFGTNSSRRFDENGLEIFGIDITAINPEDPEIAERFNDAIKSNMEIYCKKLVLTATLESERQEVEGKKKIADERKELIEKQNLNDKLEITGKAQVEAEANKIEANSEAECISIVEDAKTEAHQKKLKTSIQELGSPKEYVALQRAEALSSVQKLIVPENSRILFGGNGSFEE